MSQEILIRNGEVSLCAQAFGDEGGEPLLLIMGSTASMVWWPDGLMTRLADAGFYAIRFDHRDTGRSTAFQPGTTPYTVHDMADDALAVMDGFGLASAHIAGMSLGGLLAQLIALRNPERVRTLTLIASEIFGDPGMDTQAIDPAILDHFDRVGDVDWSDESSAVDFLATLGALTAQSDRPATPEIHRQRARTEFARARNLPSRFNHAGLDGESEWSNRTADIRQPVLILHGNRDIGVDHAHAEAIARAAPDARLVTLEGAGHDLHPDDWPRIVSEVAAHARAQR